ncbi:MAG: hypothetical protein D6689_19935 [Deltaproteobacteria bacterium]|nr:MAG: hypothetical protein D6689_19935 [Deltaproteobacteria bacterium]
MTGAHRAVAVAVAVAAGASAAPSPARAADDGDLVLAGLGMAVPTYLLGVAVHEGSHAVAARWMGYEVTRLQLLPGRHPRTGVFYFGYTQVRGRMSRAQRTWFLLAPKLTDTALLGGFAAVALTDSLPANDYAQLALTVLATGFWVDFAKDVVAWRATNDIVRVYAAHGLASEWQRLPWRTLHFALAVGAGYAIARSYADLFGGDAEASAAMPIAIPLVAGTF